MDDLAEELLKHLAAVQAASAARAAWEREHPDANFARWHDNARVPELAAIAQFTKTLRALIDERIAAARRAE